MDVQLISIHNVGTYLRPMELPMFMMTSREFNRDVSAAKRAATDSPLVITDRGEPSYVLITMHHYRALHRGQAGLARLLASDDGVESPLLPREMSQRHVEL